MFAGIDEWIDPESSRKSWYFLALLTGIVTGFGTREHVLAQLLEDEKLN
jgi:hypothetical protein